MVVSRGKRTKQANECSLKAYEQSRTQRWAPNGQGSYIEYHFQPTGASKTTSEGTNSKLEASPMVRQAFLFMQYRHSCKLGFKYCRLGNHH